MQSHRPAWFPVQFGKHSPWHRFDAVRRTALFWGQLLCPGGSCCRGRGAALMGMNPAGESTQTGTKPGFIAASTFDIHKGHSCPLLCIFMHLWPRSIWLGWGIKLGCCRDGSSQEPASPFPPKVFQAVGLVRRRRMEGDHQRHLMPQRGSISSLPPSHHALGVLSGAFLKPSWLCVWHSPYPDTPVHLTFCNPWEVSSAWLSSPSPAAHQGKAEAICWWWCLMSRDDRREQCGQWLPPNHGVHLVFTLTASRTGGGT